MYVIFVALTTQVENYYVVQTYFMTKKFYAGEKHMAERMAKEWLYEETAQYLEKEIGNIDDVDSKEDLKRIFSDNFEIENAVKYDKTLKEICEIINDYSKVNVKFECHEY